MIICFHLPSLFAERTGFGAVHTAFDKPDVDYIAKYYIIQDEVGSFYWVAMGIYVGKSIIYVPLVHPERQ